MSLLHNEITSTYVYLPPSIKSSPEGRKCLKIFFFGSQTYYSVQVEEFFYLQYLQRQK